MVIKLGEGYKDLTLPLQYLVFLSYQKALSVGERRSLRLREVFGMRRGSAYLRSKSRTHARTLALTHSQEESSQVTDP